ncbi:hypothetical protein SAMN05421830_1172 [Desulfomicrobium norvegicum]|uniref:Uncharacterized protein n=1 Tax=Desulfomicrobium norvegicum (strain DSM 1741 / NCIMB 8310) TaxID=52561 RepID=A0A8G2C6G4_DESNO|nr:hypothetical protein SAMN05421830_1172 [Desulfomicrobium norvegicum]
MSIPNRHCKTLKKTNFLETTPKFSNPEEQFECVDKKRDAYPYFDGQAKNLANHGAQSRFLGLDKRAMVHQLNSKTTQISPAYRA